MYVGNTDSSGLHHLVYEVVYNSVDEALAGHCTQIKVVLPKSMASSPSSTTAAASPSDIKEDTGKSTLEEALTVVGNSGKFDNDAYKVSAGLHGMGSKAVNALSEWMRGRGPPGRPRLQDRHSSSGYAITGLQDIGPAPASRPARPSPSSPTPTFSAR